MSRIIDLSQEIEAGRPIHPVSARPLINHSKARPSVRTGPLSRLYNSGYFFIRAHGSTPLDAPVHLGQGPITSEQNSLIPYFINLQQGGKNYGRR
jgi:kynurenine formamidase